MKVQQNVRRLSPISCIAQQLSYVVEQEGVDPTFTGFAFLGKPAERFCP
jgi:hypothetical protein